MIYCIDIYHLLCVERIEEGGDTVHTKPIVDSADVPAHVGPVQLMDDETAVEHVVDISQTVVHHLP